MTEPNSQTEGPKEIRRFSQEQYDFLKQCSEKGEKGIKEWNEWRKNHPNQDILLEGTCLKKSFLEDAILGSGTFEDDAKEKERFDGKVYLEGANFSGAHLERAWLKKARMKDANFNKANLANANLRRAHLEQANMREVHLKGAELKYARLDGAFFNYAHLENTTFEQAIVNGATDFWDCKVSRETDFRGVGLGAIRIDPGTKQLLEYNIRRKNWEEGYKEHRILQWPIRCFWWISDYGFSAPRVIGAFLMLALIFAAIYYISALTDSSSIINRLCEAEEGPVPNWLVPLRAIYFSVVTMTTLGFGDMHANSQSFWGHLLLTMQVILGYVLLAALVTRFAVLFTAGGPAGKFADDIRTDDG